jgi:hypothetical protein
MLRRVALVRTDVSEELFSVRRLLVSASGVPSSPIFITLMKEVLVTPKRRFLQVTHGVTSQETPFFIRTLVYKLCGTNAVYLLYHQQFSVFKSGYERTKSKKKTNFQWIVHVLILTNYYRGHQLIRTLPPQYEVFPLLQPRILQMLGSNLEWISDIAGRGLSWFLPTPLVKCDHKKYCTPWPLPTESFPLVYTSSYIK